MCSAPPATLGSRSHCSPSAPTRRGYTPLPEGRRFVIDLTVPANTSAEVTLWDALLDQVREGGVALNASEGVRSSRQRGNDVIVDVGSGRYSFAVTAP